MTAVRRCLTTSVALAVAAGAWLATPVGATPDGAAPLRDLAAARHRRVGTALGADDLQDTPALAVADREYSSVTPENEMKWQVIHPERDRYDFTAADRIVDHARANRMLVRGHTLVWHRQNPAWLENGTFTRDELIAVLRDHIRTVVGHFKGRVKQWDVVNEAFRDDGTGLRDNLWLRGIGPDYIPLAFRFAHEADPHAQLYLNDYLNETISPKSNYFFGYAYIMRAYGMPVDGLGVQMHRFLVIPEAPSEIRANLRRMSDAGFQVWITEMDVAVVLPADEQELVDQATVYGDVVATCLRVRRCRGITTWGFTDRSSWIPGEFPGFGAALPFDEQLEPKPAYHSIAAALRG
jgi:endo-1,4-beta-xylanase